MNITVKGQRDISVVDLPTDLIIDDPVLYLEEIRANLLKLARNERRKIMNVTIKEIVREYLKTHGYDGLYNLSFGCDCCLENLVACEDPEERCCAGYKHPDPNGKYDFIIRPEKL